MRAAPPVSVRCAGGRGWRAVQALLPALAALACGAWLCRLLDAPVAWAFVAALAAAALGWQRPATRPVALAWDGSRWQADGHDGSLDVMIDLASWLLLRWRPAAGRGTGAARWIAASATEAGAAWHALRVAAVAHAGTPAASAGAAEQARG